MQTRKFITILVIALIGLAQAPQAFSQFGRNKVQYQEFDWKFIQSKHFDVYYHQGGKYLAKYTSVILEESLGQLQKNWNYRITQRIPLIVYNSHNQFQQTNTISSMLPEGVGGVTELFKNRIVLPFQGNWEQFRHVIHHELVHAVLNDMFYGGSIQEIISNNIRTEFPLWMNEGLAEFESLNGLDVSTDMFMRDITISELLPPLERLSGFMSYRGGQTFYWYVAEKYGRGKVGELINRLRNFGRVNAAFRGTFGMDLEKFSEEWQKEIKKIYWPDLAIYEDLEDFSSRITDHEEERNFYNTSPAISPNGEQVAYIADNDGLFNVYVRNLSNGRTEEVISGQRSLDFEELNILTPGISWNPDGDKIAISAKAGGEDALYIVDVDSGDEEKISFGLRSLTSVDWSPDGRSIALVAAVNEQPDIYLYDVASGKLENLTDDIFSDMEPTWSPDSKKVFFVSNRGDYLDERLTGENFNMWEYEVHKSDVYSIDVESKTITRLTFDPEYVETSIAVAPDNESILFVSNKSGISNIYELELESEVVTPKTNSLRGITQLALSRDGHKLLFVSQNEGGYDIFSMRAPFDRELDEDPPLTYFRKRQQEREQLLSDVAAEIDEETIVEDTLSGYGSFDIDFSRQMAVQPNEDVPSEDNLEPEAEGGQDDGSALASGEFGPPKDYKINFTPDIIYGNAGFDTFFGVRGQTQMLFTDMLGDHQIYFAANLLFNLKNSDFLLAYSYLPNHIDYQFTAFHTARLVDFTQSDLTGDRFRFRYFGVSARALLPLSTFKRFELGVTWLNTDSENIDNPQEGSISKMHVVPDISYVSDNTLFGIFAPVKGTRYTIGLEGTPKLADDGLEFITGSLDFRTYLPLSDFVNFAVRGAGGVSVGGTPQRFFIGGTQNWLNRQFRGDVLPYDNAEELYFLRAGFPLRGFDINEAEGDKYFITNIEMRFPLFRALLAGPVPILFQGVMGSFFFDMGAAWDDKLIATSRNAEGQRIREDLLMSIGIGMRTIVIGLPLKLDIAWRNEYNTFSKPRYIISLGGDY